MNSYVYILTNKVKGTLYVGVTGNIERRIFEHKNKLIEGFTKKYNLKKLVFYQEFSQIGEALKREKQLKNWKRQWKIELIEEKNKEWEDLASNWNVE
ncbi:GIY-YIG nuclease family protein [Haloflavibacter putidus]|uniref:GIY-YIG nuclease family protein n=1 Tax=Haloflavibacter putidus TaxID=2576776 RepID=A0A508A1Q3_9FLAO|nr:GIY-YIG nuclease family protein [Haloflavibacter putidus]